MTPRIESLPEKKLTGKKCVMSFAQNKTGELWKNFMSQRNEISNGIGTDLISMAVYKPNFFAQFNPSEMFEKWAAVEVANFDLVPQQMETFIIQEGLYAVFNYKGLSNNPAIFQYIFISWLPSSPYNLDNRPHFEVLGEKYKNNDPESEEEIWIPIKQKT